MQKFGNCSQILNILQSGILLRTTGTPRLLKSDPRTGGKFLFRMEAKDGSFGFDFFGTYDEVKENELIEITLGDGRKVNISFLAHDQETKVKEIFEAEQQNTIEIQRTGWQAILDNFKKYAEAI